MRASVRDRHEDAVDDADAAGDDTGPAARLLAAWSDAIARASGDLTRVGCAVAALDLATEATRCFAPLLTPPLGMARLAALAVLVPATLRALALRHADRSDAELLKAIAAAAGVGAVYVAIRTGVVVGVCGM